MTPCTAGTAGEEEVESDWLAVLDDCGGDATGDASAAEFFREAAGEVIANSKKKIAMHWTRPVKTP
jgi:hypothetical protein